MRNSKGFTLMELMVGMVILSAAIAGALSFFIFQSTRGHESFRDKSTDEQVFSALALIARDIHSAGFGCVSRAPSLVIQPIRNSGFPDELYVNYSDYMVIQYYDKNDTQVALLRRNSVFGDARPNDATYQGVLKLTDAANMRLLAVPHRSSTTVNSSVGAIIATSNPDDSTLTPIVCDVNVKTSSAVANASVAGTQDWTFPIATPAISGLLAIGDTAVPAVSYKIRYYRSDGTLYTGNPSTILASDLYDSATGTIFGSLWRNRGPDSNVYGVPILGWSPNGGNPFINVRDFRIRRQYNTTDTNFSHWDVPLNTGETLETSPDPKNVRLLEITVTYQTNVSKETIQSSGKPKAIWSQPVTRVIRVSPRHLALLDS
ncbi:MAG: prepilin-type N-terminal cleavage/methylation domain-containing protein [Desulfomonile tiedjei]|uniref:Prepilin-type N-terminal cleavage/methylation domain-containing protein n=1 Tax=Desulfomonile tiedjei TaxID=2358 RepID=A0A9D6V6H5_9BACT|nr:prepilin-type N-terminal cleavage/methylation domain-containing protein [Desulfomonile tiedjei]